MVDIYRQDIPILLFVLEPSGTLYFQFNEQWQGFIAINVRTSNVRELSASRSYITDEDKPSGST
jgi:hypothetical protein